jgi:hypothetical protein
MVSCCRWGTHMLIFMYLIYINFNKKALALKVRRPSFHQKIWNSKKKKFYQVDIGLFLESWETSQTSSHYISILDRLMYCSLQVYVSCQYFQARNCSWWPHFVFRTLFMLFPCVPNNACRPIIFLKLLTTIHILICQVFFLHFVQCF